MEPWPAGVGREVHATLDSTNAEALRRAATTPGPLWILALEQSAARGRRGRAWTTGRGNFAATLLMTPSGGPGEAALRSFVAALALHEVLTGLVGAPGRFSLKWPNDVLVDGGKLAGILLETAGPPLRLAVGFGVNLVEAPVDLPPEAERAASLADATGQRLVPEALLDALAPAFARWEARLVGEGFAPLREAWLARAARLGEAVVARLPGARHEGRFETIDASGALVLATDGGQVVLPAAEVYFGDGARDASRD